MVAPVLPPDVPLVGSGRMRPAWWRWFRDLNDAVGSATSALDAGRALTNQALVVGNNTIAHGLGRVPSGWFPTRLEGSFPVSSGGTDVVYPEIVAPRFSGFDGTPAGGVPEITLTMGITPADGKSLVAVIHNEDSGRSIASITQAGVTWARIAGPVGSGGGINGAAEMWLGHTVASAATSMTITYDANISSVLQVGVCVVEVSEITATSARDAGASEQATASYGLDSTSELSGSPVAEAGDIAVVALSMPWSSGSGDRTVHGHGWRCVGFHRFSGDQEGLMLFVRTAQADTEQFFRAIGMSSARRAILAACFDSSLGAVGGASVTIPHGLRQVSSDATNLVLNSISEVTADVWVF